MLIERVECLDGKIRYARILTTKKRKKFSSLDRDQGIQQQETLLIIDETSRRSLGVATGTKVNFLDTSDQNLDKFESIWLQLTGEYFGRKIPFFGNRKKNLKKVLIALKVIENVERNGIDLRLFLRAQFDLAKINKRYLYPGHLQSPKAVRRYRAWARRYANKRDALARFESTSLLDIIKNDHNLYKYYTVKLKLPPNYIFRRHHTEFSHFYLASYPEFLELYEKEPTSFSESWKTQHEEIWKIISSDVHTTRDLWNLVEEVKCS